MCSWLALGGVRGVGLEKAAYGQMGVGYTDVIGLVGGRACLMDKFYFYARTPHGHSALEAIEHSSVERAAQLVPCLEFVLLDLKAPRAIGELNHLYNPGYCRLLCCVLH